MPKTILRRARDWRHVNRDAIRERSFRIVAEAIASAICADRAAAAIAALDARADAMRAERDASRARVLRAAEGR